jgi:putative mRNA 3-end processing factor
MKRCSIIGVRTITAVDDMATSRPDDLIRPERSGLWCERGGFHIDPRSAVPLAIVTHAHADHATAGCGRYIATPRTAALLRVRLGSDIVVEELDCGSERDLGDTRVSLHPAGHVLGSAQVRVEASNEPVWCISGDYGTQPSSTAERFEVVQCDVFVTESTFGLPLFRWPDADAVAVRMRVWCEENAAAGRTSVLFAYSLGKAQRVLAAIDGIDLPIGVHGAVRNISAVYDACGVVLPDAMHANAEHAAQLKGQGVIVAPPSQAATPWLRRFAGPEGMRTAMVSGWMTLRGRRRWQSLDGGFVLSDHVDWPSLLDTIERTGATRVGVTHGYVGPLARYLREERGLDAFVLPTRWGDEEVD